MLRDSPDEEWQCFDVYQGQYPSVDELDTFDAVVITGSKCSTLRLPRPPTVAPPVVCKHAGHQIPAGFQCFRSSQCFRDGNVSTVYADPAAYAAH